MKQKIQLCSCKASQRDGQHMMWCPANSDPSSVSTPAQDATALADELAREAATYQVGSRTRQLLHKAADALRATPQTPDAAAMLDAEAARYGGEKAVYTGNHVSNILATQATRLRSTPSASAGPQAISDEHLAEWVQRLDWDTGLSTADEIKQLRALLTHIGFCAPQALLREPTEAMLCAARDWSIKKFHRGIGDDAAIGCWQAMYDARPQQADGRDAVIDECIAAIDKFMGKGSVVAFRVRAALQQSPAADNAPAVGAQDGGAAT